MFDLLVRNSCQNGKVKLHCFILVLVGIDYQMIMLMCQASVSELYIDVYTFQCVVLRCENLKGWDETAEIALKIQCYVFIV